MRDKQAVPMIVTCPYCKRPAYQLKDHRLAGTRLGRNRFGCDNAHYFVYPELPGLAPVSPRKESHG